jgi:hypothetical protein
MKFSHRYLIFVLGVVLLLFPMLASGCGPQSQEGTVSSTNVNNHSNPIPKDFAQFSVGPLSVVRGGTSVGETATVSTTITNTGGIQGTYKAVLTVNGNQVGQKDVSIVPGGTGSVNFQVAENDPGKYTLAIGDSSATLNVYKWPYIIQYDLGNAASELLSVAGDNGHIVHFTPPTTPFKIQKIDMYIQGMAYNDSTWDKRFVTVRIWNSGRNQQLWSIDLPWRKFWNDVGSFWQDVPVPNVRSDGDFYVEVVTHSDQFQGELLAWPWGTEIRPAIFIAYEKGSPYESSTVSTAETPSGISSMGQSVALPSQYQGINWLIRVTGDGSL